MKRNMKFALVALTISIATLPFTACVVQSGEKLPVPEFLFWGSVNGENNGNYIAEFRLPDGTVCVRATHYVNGGSSISLACDFNKRVDK